MKKVIQTLPAAVALCTCALILTGFLKPSAGTEVPVIRASQIELVDKQGKVRASMKIEDSGETVFRIMDQDGTIRVKIGGDKDGSGVVLLDDSTSPAVHLLAKSAGTFVRLKGKDGTSAELKPE